MATIRQLRRRISSVKNTAKITNALQLVAASKMRRAQDRAAQAHPYAEKLRAVIAGLSTGVGEEAEALHPLLVQRPPQTIAVLHVTPDRGLCGGLNANLNRSAGSFIAMQHEPANVIAVGKKGRDFFTRAHVHITAEFIELGDYPTQADTLGVARVIIDDYIEGVIDKVFVSYPELVSTAVQHPVIRQLLPIEPPQMDTAEEGETFRRSYIFEPSPAGVLERLLPRYIEMQIYEAVLQTAASFQSAQMVAMKNATD
ncbi:MAG: ATP synthase F1 subunit gamma, partial [Dehalococcoidia bacterium]